MKPSEFTPLTALVRNRPMFFMKYFFYYFLHSRGYRRKVHAPPLPILAGGRNVPRARSMMR